MSLLHKPKSPGIKGYYEELRTSAGLTSTRVAEKLGITNVTMSHLSWKLDEMSGEQIHKLGKMFGVDPGEFLKNIIKLRALDKKNK